MQLSDTHLPKKRTVFVFVNVGDFADARSVKQHGRVFAVGVYGCIEKLKVFHVSLQQRNTVELAKQHWRSIVVFPHVIMLQFVEYPWHWLHQRSVPFESGFRFVDKWMQQIE